MRKERKAGDEPAAGHGQLTRPAKASPIAAWGKQRPVWKKGGSVPTTTLKLYHRINGPIGVGHWREEESLNWGYPAGLCGGLFTMQSTDGPEKVAYYTLSSFGNQPLFFKEPKASVIHLVAIRWPSQQDCTTQSVYAICKPESSTCLGIKDYKCRSNCAVEWKTLPKLPGPSTLPSDQYLWNVRETEPDSNRYMIQCRAGYRALLGASCIGVLCSARTKMRTDWVDTWAYKLQLVPV